MTKEELIELIMEVAPQTFHENIKNNFVSQEKALDLFQTISDRISDIFSDEELLYNPSEFEHALLQQLEKLRGLWKKLPSEIGKLMIRIIQDVEDAFENGYLYLEKYGEEDDYFESEEVNENILQFIKFLPENIRSEYIEEFEDILSNTGYSTFLSIERNLSKI